MSTINKKCQVPTPREIVVHMLDTIGYTSDLYGKRVLENSCGSGAFLSVIVERYIKDCLSRHLSQHQICYGLQRDIHGFEKDRKLHKECIRKLDWIARAYGLDVIHWNIKRRNALHAAKHGKYQFVIGNPPYLAYPEQDEATRSYIKKRFESCSNGKPDYYYAFIESAINSLAPDGKLAYLVPANFMKNQHSEKLRQLICPSLYKIEDYSHRRLFGKILTSSVILYCNLSENVQMVEYKNVQYSEQFTVSKKEMVGKWKFGYASKKGDLVFADYFRACAPVATQFNRAFVISGWQDCENDLIKLDKYQIEKAVLRKAAGPKSLQSNIEERIIFPYEYRGGEITHYSEERFKRLFPNAFQYLTQFKNSLEARDADKKSQWFEYGRSQLLLHLNQKKLILSSFVTQKPHVYLLDEDTVPYAGICVIAFQNHTLQNALEILNSEEFMIYVKKTGVCTSGVSYRISPTDINKFRFPKDMLEG